MERVVDNFHGTMVSDPYRWLENQNDSEVTEWITVQNEKTQKFLKPLEQRNNFRKRLTELWNYVRISAPLKVNSWYFYEKNSGLQNQPVLYRQEGLTGSAEVVLDPNSWSSDGTVALAGFSVDNSGRYLAYSVSAHGSDRQEIKIRDLRKKEDLSEVIKWCKFTNVTWLKDRGFYYSRYPKPGSVLKEDENNFNQVYWHELGTDQEDDVLIYDSPDEKELSFHPSLTLDRRFLTLHAFRGTDQRNGFLYRELEKATSFVELFKPGEASFEFLGSEDTKFYFLTDLDAPKGKIICLDLENPERENWQEILPEQQDAISVVLYINGEFIIEYMHDVYSVVRIFHPEKGFIADLNLPTMGSVEAFSGRQDHKEFFVKFTSFLYPSVNFHYDLETRQLTLFGEQHFNFKPHDYMVSQVFYPSKDGTEIPMFLVHKKDLELNGENPTLLYGYGGFNISIVPSFSASRILWLELGGVFAVANLRGGSEYGEDWHQAGILGNKQNVFDDFIAAAEWLISNDYTVPRLLAIEGRSNGGLLVSASMVQRPDLFGAVICGVPVTDMLRYHKFTVGRYWVPEYGNAEENPEHFEFLYKYSPLHNVRFSDYPATLVITADGDDRVVPAHAYKFTASLQAAQRGTDPILCRIDTKSGHGHGKPISKIIEEQVDVYSFLVRVFAMKVSIFDQVAVNEEDN